MKATLWTACAVAGAALIGATPAGAQNLTGEIKVDGQSWTARPYLSDLVIEQGTEVEVYEIDGAIAVVYPKHGALP